MAIKIRIKPNSFLPPPPPKPDPAAESPRPLAGQLVDRVAPAPPVPKEQLLYPTGMPARIEIADGIYRRVFDTAEGVYDPHPELAGTEYAVLSQSPHFEYFDDAPAEVEVEAATDTKADAAAQAATTEPAATTAEATTEPAATTAVTADLATNPQPTGADAPATKRLRDTRKSN